MHKEVRQLIRQLGAFPGVRVESSRRHTRVYKDDAWVTTLPSTPSDHRWYRNTLSTLKRAGIDLLNPPMPVRKEVQMATVEQYDYTRNTTSGAITVTPTSQFTALDSGQNVSTFETRQSGFGKTSLTADSFEALFARLVEFLSVNFGFPNETGAVPRFVRFVENFSKTYEGRSYKSFASAEISLRNMLARRTSSVTDWVGLLLNAAMDSFDAETEAAQEERFQRKSRAKRAKNLKKFYAKEKAIEPVAPVTSDLDILRAELSKLAKKHQKEAGIQPNKHTPWGKGTFYEMGQVILTRGTATGFEFHRTYKSGDIDAHTIAKRMAEFINNRKGLTKIEGWMEKELRAYIKLYKDGRKAPTPEVPIVISDETKIEPVAPIVVEPVSTPMDAFFTLIEGRALTRNGLQDAYALAEMQAAFENSHPRG